MERRRTWPICPPPQPEECLSSWLFRVAKAYRLPLHKFIRAANLPLDLHYLRLGEIDIAAPKVLEAEISRLSGVAVERIHSMTLASVVPMLATSAVVQPHGFRSYIHGFRVLPHTPRSEKSLIPLPSRPWERTKLQTRLICPDCLLADEAPYLRLTWATGVTSTCPLHGILLVPPAAHYLDEAFENGEWLPRTPVQSEHHLQLDRMTSLAFTRGWVPLPDGRRMEGSTWLRFLRSFVDELARAEEHYWEGLLCEPNYARIWKMAGGSTPVKANKRDTFEDAADLYRCALFRAAGVGVALLFAGELIPRSSRAQALSPLEALRSNERFSEDPLFWLRRQLQEPMAIELSD